MNVRQCTTWRRKFAIFILLGLSGLFCLVGPALGAEEGYPNGPITIYVGDAPGASSGISAQLFADGAKKYLPKSQPILVAYKPGAATALAADYVLKQPADGYTLLWFSMSLAAKLGKDADQVPFKLEDFMQIGAFLRTPFIMVYNKEKSPAKTLDDFIALAKKKPGEISYGNTGIGASTHVCGELFQKRAGIKLNQIPFNGAAPALTALMGGHTDSVITTLASAAPNLQPGGLLGLMATLSADRLKAYPEAPTFMEKGIEMDRDFFLSLSAPKGTPPAVLKILQEVLRKTADDPIVSSSIEKMGYMPANWTPEQTTKKFKEEFDASKEIFAKTGK
jgi:tripartite-type tricarboxylate transporter receptor subunit TctC